MGITHLSGLEIAGVPTQGMAGLPIGNTYIWVDSVNGNNGNDGSASSPVATLVRALAMTVASTGTVIVIKAGHTEAITSATTLGFSVAGVQIVGLGSGSTRPTFTFTTANTATIAVSAANVKISNCIFIGNFLSIASCFTVGAAPEFVIDSCCFRDTSAVLGFLSIVTTTVSVNADGLTFTNNEVISNATTSPGPAIVVAGTISRLTIVGNFIVHTTISNNVAAILAHGALVVSYLNMGYNRVYSVNTDTATGGILLTTTATTGSGMIYVNYAATLDTAAAIMFPAIAVQYGAFNNQHAHRGNSTSGYLLPAAGTD